MIFLHSSFRTSSTWLWDKFRSQGDLLSYYEVFNEKLATISAEDAKTSSYLDWNSKHHPTAPYFLEYLPLIQENGGVDRYRPEIAYACYIPQDGPQGDITEMERHYLNRLVEHAEQLGKRPVLSCTRSIGRIAGIRRAFPGVHILIYRNMFHQWCSYTDQNINQNPGFLDSIRYTLTLNKKDELISEICRRYSIEENEQDTTKLFIAFILIHLYFYANCANHIDILVDVNRLSSEPGYREIIEGEIRDKCGPTLDLSDVRQSLGATFTLFGSRKETEDLLEPWVTQIVAAAPSEVGRYLAIKAYMDFLDEYERYFFYAGPVLNAWKPVLNAWETGKALQEEEHRKVRDEYEAVVDERNRMRNSLSWRATAPFRRLGALLPSRRL
jgi:hypothetical protein